MYTTDNEVKKIASVAFPEYSGKKFRVEIEENPINVAYNNYWSGGSRTYYNFVRLDTLQSFGEIPAQSAFDKAIIGADKVQLIPGLVCVQRDYFCGKDMGITIKVHPENAPKLIGETVELTRDEKIVLIATRSFKNTYGGRTNIRFLEGKRETGIEVEQWETAKKGLIEKGMLNKAGSITNEGRNAIGRTRFYELK